MSLELTRDALMTDPRLVEIVQAEAKRVAVALKLDTVDAKEVYRSMVSVCIEVAMTIQTQGEPVCDECGKPAGSDGDKCFGCFVHNQEQKAAAR